MEAQVLVRTFMRISRIASLLAFLASASSALAAERCQDISDVVAAAVISKPKVIELLRKNPQKGTLS
jgi:hypothetical protein